MEETDRKPSALNDLEVALNDAHSLLTRLENRLESVSGGLANKVQTAAASPTLPNHVNSLVSSANAVRERLETILNSLVI